MTSKRCVARLLYSRPRISAQSSVQACRNFSIVHQPLHRSSFTHQVPRKPTAWQIAIPANIQRRCISNTSENQPPKKYTFNEILNMLDDLPSPNRLLIDVREPHEFDANSIPTAINIPVTSHPDALLLSDEEFQDRFGFAKPPLDAEVVFFCKAGVRSRASAGIAREAGYTNVAEYPGSWLDWEKNGGPGTKDPASS